jgi:RNA polymerase sigma factor (sigma-70 family)
VSQAGSPDPAPAENTADAAGDRLLWDRYVARGDQTAFAALVERHGPMVLGVCRRVLRHTQDAEDAFQATFLVLAHKARAVNRPELLGPWLYGVAYRTALKARGRAGTRQPERLRSDVPARPSTGSVEADVRAVLDEELGRLPEKYRAPLVLCYLEGQSTEDAARALGCPRGTVLSRLARGRDRLRRRLERRGLILAGAAVTVVLSGGSPAAAEIPRGVVESLGRGPAAASPAVCALLQDVTHGMRREQLLIRAVYGLAVLGVLAALGIGYGLRPGHDAGKAAAPADPDRLQGNWRLVTVRVSGREVRPADYRIQWLVVRGDRISFGGRGQPREATFRVDPAANPKSIDLNYRNDDPMGNMGMVESLEGVYELEGDNFVLCQSEMAGTGRPNSLASPPDSGLVLMTFRRERN